jgi:hypothetical protein
MIRINMSRERSPAPDNPEEPAKDEVNTYIEGLENQLREDSSGTSRGASRFEKRQESSRAYYEKACARARTFISVLDPELRVSVDEVAVQPESRSSQEYQTYALRFFHRTRAHLGWTMEIEENDHYIQNQLENVVREIYERKAHER